MRFRHTLALALGALALLAVAPQSARACHWGWGHHHYGYGYAPAYYAPPMMYAPPVMYAPPDYAVPMPPAPAAIPTVPVRPATTSAVVAADDRFDPPTLTVAPGTTVQWTNNGKHAHTVTDRGGKFDSGDVAPGASYSVTFRTPGTYKYYCKHHKGMEGTIVVGQPGTAPGGATGPAPKTGY